MKPMSLWTSKPQTTSAWRIYDNELQQQEPRFVWTHYNQQIGVRCQRRDDSSAEDPPDRTSLHSYDVVLSLKSINPACFLPFSVARSLHLSWSAIDNPSTVMGRISTRSCYRTRRSWLLWQKPAEEGEEAEDDEGEVAAARWENYNPAVVYHFCALIVILTLYVLVMVQFSGIVGRIQFHGGKEESCWCFFFKAAIWVSKRAYRPAKNVYRKLSKWNVFMNSNIRIWL